MTYQERFTQAVKDHRTKDVSPEWVAFEKKDQSVLGKLLGTSAVDSSLGSGSYLQYMMETDDGLIKFSLGAATDKELAPVIKVGGVYKITYQGQQKIKGGRRVNRFKVVSLGDADDLGVTEEDIPF